jgi:hypothetical protein
MKGNLLTALVVAGALPFGAGCGQDLTPHASTATPSPIAIATPTAMPIETPTVMALPSATPVVWTQEMMDDFLALLMDHRFDDALALFETPCPDVTRAALETFVGNLESALAAEAPAIPVQAPQIPGARVEDRSYTETHVHLTDITLAPEDFEEVFHPLPSGKLGWPSEECR